MVTYHLDTNLRPYSIARDTLRASIFLQLMVSILVCHAAREKMCWWDLTYIFTLWCKTGQSSQGSSFLVLSLFWASFLVVILFHLRGCILCHGWCLRFEGVRVARVMLKNVKNILKAIGCDAHWTLSLQKTPMGDSRKEKTLWPNMPILQSKLQKGRHPCSRTEGVWQMDT